MPTAEQPNQAVLQFVRAKGGVVRTVDVTQGGFHHDILGVLRDAGELEQIAYGVYMLPELALELPPEQIDFLAVMQRTPKAVICLESALSYHEITTRIPQVVHLALPRSVSKPKYRQLKVEGYHFSDATYAAGVTTVNTKAGEFRVYSPEKTLADCFKFRNQLDKEMLLEALELYPQTHPINTTDLVKYAKLCRVESVMQPYLETMLH